MKKELKENGKKRKYFWIILIILTTLVISVAIGSYVFINYQENLKNYQEDIITIKDTNNGALLNYNEEVLYQTEWTYSDLINYLVQKNNLIDGTEIKVVVNGQSFSEKDILKFDTIGEYKIEISLTKIYSYKKWKEEQEIIENKKETIIKVVDKVAPVIEGVKDKTITVGDSINILEGITAKDEVDGDIEVQSEGVVDTKKAGTYKIKIYAIDKSGNREEKEMTVTVKAKTTTQKPSNSSESNTQKPSSGSTSSSNTCTYTSTLKARGYNSKDKDACEKDRQASIVAKQIANEIMAQGLSTDLEKVSAAAKRVSEYYVRENHIEEGYDYRTPYGVFITHAASCAGCTRALIQVLQYMGYTNLKHANENGWTHQWVILNMDGQIGYADGQIGVAGYGEY